MNREMLWPVVPLLLLCLVFVIAQSRPTPSAEGDLFLPAEGVAISEPFIDSIDCASDPGTATVVFAWAPVTVKSVSIDVSSGDDRFPEGTFLSTGPLPASQGEYAWKGVGRDAPLYWRLSYESETGVQRSATHLLAPCTAVDLQSQQSCAADGRIEFSWKPSSLPVVEQWLDVTRFDNGFAPGTYSAAGPLAPDADTLEWDGLAGAAIFWRLTMLTDDGWVYSDVRTIDACNTPLLLTPSYSCVGDTATVEFRWAPPSPPAQAQYLDLSRELNGFAAGTYITAGPLPSSASRHTWASLRANETHFVRINALTDNGWVTSMTRSFTPNC
jgi:hypothetical protein